ncbi:MAG: polyamine aminopropyltransferase [Oscillospiraceae bacterium]|nr:polyamine aminopropyltransferase [Oscillospiraceae bacterium]
MELWFTEETTDDIRFSLRVKRHLFSGRSEFQQIDVFDTVEYGWLLTIDGWNMCTQKDEFIYHEMIVHVPMAVRPGIRKVLVVGGGDGGTVRELTRYATVEQIDLVEIDEMVVSVCREYLPQTACRLDDERVRIHYRDGIAFVAEKEDEYDLIIVDSPDPIGPAKGLFAGAFYKDCYRALREDGILVNQFENPFYEWDSQVMQAAFRELAPVFPINEVYQANIPSYPSGHWLFSFASKKNHPVRGFEPEKWDALGLETGYYNTGLHIGAFALPNYVKKLLREAEGN